MTPSGQNLISCQKVTPKKELPGWSFNELENASFTSPPITDSPTDFFPDCSPQNCHILLISAPGAVGKSTLAKHISYLTGAIYVDLGKAKPVGGDTLTGGLSKTKSQSSWENDHTTVILDGLDEAILKVKSEGYATFIEDVVECSQEEGRTKPIILLGRKRAAEDTLLC